MFITDRLTVGQITFIIRSSSSTSKTHDAVNRILGKATATRTSVLWLIYSFRSGDGHRPIGLLFAILLSLLFGGSATTDQPSSVTSMELAGAAINRTVIKGADLSEVVAYRCDGAEIIQPNANVTLSSCLSWRNGTLGDPTFFSELNMTDSDILLPRLARRSAYKRREFIELNSFYVGPNNQRIEEPIISEGVVVAPHATGLRAIFGAPELQPQSRVVLEQVMALEVEMGCMTAGIYSEESEDNGVGTDTFATNSSWRQYNGPEELYDPLSRTVDNLRAFYLPLFNTSSIDSTGLMRGINSSSTAVSRAASIQSIPFTSVGLPANATDRRKEILGNCTESIRSRLNIPGPSGAEDDGAYSCNILSITGSVVAGGVLYNYLSRMACAATSQLNLVTATVETDNMGKIAVSSFERHPSDLHYVHASLYDPVSSSNNITFWWFFEPFERYTLNPSPTSPSTHYIDQHDLPASPRATGAGSGGYILSRVGSSMLDLDALYESSRSSYMGLTALKAGQNPISFDNVTKMTTEWGGQVGASMVVSSLAMNGYAALHAPALTVESTGGVDAVCYTAPYALVFLPLVLSALIIVGWIGILFAKYSSSFRFANQLQGLYTGMSPYWGVVCPNESSWQVVLAWDNSPSDKPHLAFAGSDPYSRGAWTGTAMEFMRSGDHPLRVLRTESETDSKD
ncbi:hypothetical protein PM082_017008 [Marasmius tenuissimus]|nr:hypothetical protein PM082_017008 [Marasmius tenuissimus]